MALSCRTRTTPPPRSATATPSRSSSSSEAVEPIMSDIDPFVLAARQYRSRLIVGSGKYRSFEETRRATEAAGAEIITVAVRRVNITDPGKENLLDHLPPDRFTILPNTAGCYTAEDAVRTARLPGEAGVGTLVKLEVIGDERTLFPDVPATIEAARILVADAFTALPYVSDDTVEGTPRRRGARPPQPGEPAHHPRDGRGPGDRRRGRRHGERRDRRDGARLRRRAH